MLEQLSVSSVTLVRVSVPLKLTLKSARLLSMLNRVLGLFVPALGGCTIAERMIRSLSVSEVSACKGQSTGR